MKKETSAVLGAWLEIQRLRAALESLVEVEERARAAEQQAQAAIMVAIRALMGNQDRSSWQ